MEIEAAVQPDLSRWIEGFDFGFTLFFLYILVAFLVFLYFRFFSDIPEFPFLFFKFFRLPRFFLDFFNLLNFINFSDFFNPTNFFENFLRQTSFNMTRAKLRNTYPNRIRIIENLVDLSSDNLLILVVGPLQKYELGKFPRPPDGRNVLNGFLGICLTVAQYADLLAQ